jgi:hypothetical protein
MYDAEVAATLLNRWSAVPRIDVRDHSLDLLREGNLNFARRLGQLRSDGTNDCFLYIVEFLFFVDGSCALRVNFKNTNDGWSRWGSVESIKITAESSTA